MSDAMNIFDRRAVRMRRDRAAAVVEQFGFLFREVADRLADRLLDVKHQFPNALDIGCRNGECAIALRSTGRVDRLVQCEFSEKMARRAEGPVLVADEEALPFAAHSFDLALSNLALHWVNDLPGCLLQVHRSLKPNGLFLAAVLGGDTLIELRECLLEAEIDLRDGASPRLSPFMQINDAGALLQRAGFALPVIDSDKITVTYENMFRLMADLRGMGEANATFARPRNFTGRSLFMRAAELYAERFTDPDGRIRATFEVIYMHGWTPHESQQQPLRPGSADTHLSEILQSESEEDPKPH